MPGREKALDVLEQALKLKRWGSKCKKGKVDAKDKVIEK